MSGDDDVQSPARQRWQSQLVPYVATQRGVADLRSRRQPEPPWPDPENPMLGYLMERAAEILEEQGAGPAIVWAITHAWFESAIATRSTMMDDLGS